MPVLPAGAGCDTRRSGRPRSAGGADRNRAAARRIDPDGRAAQTGAERAGRGSRLGGVSGSAVQRTN